MSAVRLREERGAVVAIVALSLVALFGMVVLTVDVGGLLTKRRSMVNASDAAALAAAQSYALGIEAQCGSNDAPAQSKADLYAQDNVAGSSRLPGSAGWEPDCAKQNIRVAYETQQGLFFAPVLGFGSSAKVTATATAHWGPTGGGTPMPVELDPLITNDCVYSGGNYNDPQVCPEGYWFDNGDLTNSGWGLMNLNTWGVPKDGACDNSGGANELSGWILQSTPLSVLLATLPTYVCTTDGGKTPNWVSALEYWAQVWDTWVAAGSPAQPPPTVPPVFLFPVNDPAQMVFGPPTSQQKYAIVSFAPMQVVHVYDVGKDPDGALGGTFSCDANYSFGTGQSIDLTTEPLVSINGSDCSELKRSSFKNLTLKPASGGKPYKQGSDYTWDSTTHILTWTSAPATVELTFDYRGKGPCSGHDQDPNAFCLQLAWAGPQLIGFPCSDCLGTGPAMAVNLIR